MSNFQKKCLQTLKWITYWTNNINLLLISKTNNFIWITTSWQTWEKEKQKKLFHDNHFQEWQKNSFWIQKDIRKRIRPINFQTPSSISPPSLSVPNMYTTSRFVIKINSNSTRFNTHTHTHVLVVPRRFSVSSSRYGTQWNRDDDDDDTRTKIPNGNESARKTECQWGGRKKGDGVSKAI